MPNYGQALKTSYYNINTAPLDGKLTPVLTLEDLKALDTSSFYEGMELTVLNINKKDENDTTNIPVRFNVKYNENFERTYSTFTLQLIECVKYKCDSFKMKKHIASEYYTMLTVIKRFSIRWYKNCCVT